MNPCLQVSLMPIFLTHRMQCCISLCSYSQSAHGEVAQLRRFRMYSTILDGGHLHRPVAYFSHGVRHPVDHVHHSESEGEHSPGVDVDGVGIDGLADALGTAFLLLLSLLCLLGPPPPWLSLLGTALPWYFAAGTLTSALAARDHHALVHASDRQGEQNHSLFAVFYNRLEANREMGM